MSKMLKKVEKIFQNMLSQNNQLKKPHLKPNQATISNFDATADIKDEWALQIPSQ